MHWRAKYFPRRLPVAVTVALICVFAVSFVTACVTNQSAIGRVVTALKDDVTPLPADTRVQLNRFAEVYDTYAQDASDRERLDYFNFAFRRVRNGYVHATEDAVLIDAAIAGVVEEGAEPGTVTGQEIVEDGLHRMLKALDPHSSYLNAEEFQETFANTRGEFGGLGIQVTMEGDYVKVIAPIEDTPAERAGILAGDLITAIDGIDVKGKRLRDAVRLMRGHPGQPVDITIRRANVPDFDVHLVRAVIEVKSVRHRIEGDIGYIRITRFNEKTREGITAALGDIRSQLGDGLKGVVVDLRNNPGGLLNQSVVVADTFLDHGKIVAIKGRHGRDERSYYAEPGDLSAGVPVIILVNRGSASASEIVASALQYHDRAVVMGDQTFGKGSVQTIMPLPLEGALRLTTALYYSPDDVAIQAVGVTPDILVTPEGAVEAQAERSREADLPGAIPAQSAVDGAMRPRISEQACPAIGEAEDHVLGCALEYLRSKSEQAFIRRYVAANAG